MTKPEVTFYAFAPGVRGGIESDAESGWHVATRTKDDTGRIVERRLAGPFKTASEATTVANALALKGTP